ncbi:MAG: class I adenylate cyclase, partial [Gammaproteobacteria bacterium]|nr:class I adenylate cyclase [Gammaproteobacteria bacterium]
VCRWADEQGQELHIFVMTAEQFRAGRTAEQVDSENCGSAQHTLLLDEFYRTAIHLAGGYPLWWLIPADQEGDYARWARQLCDCRFVREDAFVDFGPVPRLPPGEFLGAGVWQLYKGIDDPWKAILKLMLIESYARSEHAEPLALAYKRRVHGGGVQADDVDPYILLYRHLEAYLAQETERLELVRRCLYLKTGLRLSRVERQQQRDDWRVRLLEQIVTAWGWTLTQLRRLDRRAQWRLGEVQRERRVIVNELTRGYRELSLLAREHKVRPNIREDDLVLLGRKLYAAFQRKAGKIELINNGIAPSLSEDSLAFHHASARPQAEPAEDWRVYRDLA